MLPGGPSEDIARPLAEQLDLPVERVAGALEALWHRRMERMRGEAPPWLRDRDRRGPRHEPGRRHEARDRFAADVAAELDIAPRRVQGAMRWLFAERMQALVTGGWITEKARDAALACYDDESACAGMPPGIMGLGTGPVGGGPPLAR